MPLSYSGTSRGRKSPNQTLEALSSDHLLANLDCRYWLDIGRRPASTPGGREPGEEDSDNFVNNAFPLLVLYHKERYVSLVPP